MPNPVGGAGGSFNPIGVQDESSSSAAGLAKLHETEHGTEDVRAVTSAFNDHTGPPQSTVHTTAGPEIEEEDIEPSGKDWSSLSKTEVEGLSKSELEQALIEADPDTLKKLRGQMTPEQKKYVDNLLHALDEETGITEHTQRHTPAQANSVQQAVNPVNTAGAAPTGPRKLQKKRRPDYTEFDKLRQNRPAGRGISVEPLH
jgi:hypothetical protein